MSWRSTRASGQGAAPNRTVAVVDLGSNSWRLVVFTYGDGPWWKRTDEIYETVRIGAGLAASGRLSDDAISRGLETLSVFGRFARANGITAQDVHVVATSAIRDAANGADFLERAEAQSGLRIEILDAQQEAFYGYVAAVNTTTLTDGAVLDIGGGSMQLTRVEGRHSTETVSFPLGAVRMTEQFLSDSDPSRPAKRKQLQRLRDHVDAELETAPWVTHLQPRPPRLVGIGGAVRNLAAAAQEATNANVDLGVQGYVITHETLRELVATLAALAPAQRGTVPGIKPGRGDIILASAIVLERVVDRCGFAGIETTEAGLREGVFIGRVLLSPTSPLIADVRGAAVRNLAIQYESDLRHVEHVARLSLQMFDSMAAGGLFTPHDGERELLWAAI